VPESPLRSGSTAAQSCPIPTARPKRRAGSPRARVSVARTRRRATTSWASVDRRALPHPVEQRLSASFTSASHSLLGVIQGGALGVLAVEVVGGHRSYGVLEWLMVGVTGLMLIVVWRHLSINAMVFNWRHSLWDPLPSAAWSFFSATPSRAASTFG
jgi:hypothetical protein